VQHDIARWLDEALNQIPAELNADSDGTTHRQIADSYLRPLLKRCRAATKSRFWQWLRLQLARTEEIAPYLLWMRESRCPLEVKTSTGSEGGFQYVVNGDVALIEIASDTDHAVWRVPASRLEWALALYPVGLRRLPPLESNEARQLRLLRRRVKREMQYLTQAQRQAFERKIQGLEESCRKAYEPAPRFMLVKYQDGQEIPLHRLFIDAQRNDEVEAVDGDFLNFTTATIRVTVEPVTVDGLTIVKGNRPPSAWSEELVVPNIYISDSDQSQKDFEDAFLQVKRTAQGDIDTHLQIQPNAIWRAGCHGLVVDAGKFDPISEDDVVPVDYVGRGGTSSKDGTKK
jgi:hypothetical protein